MLRCNNCGYSNRQYGRHGARYGFSGCGCAAMSDTEYDNMSDEDDNDGWMTTSSLSDRFRSHAVPNCRFPPHNRHGSASVPPNRHRIQPIQAALNFGGDSLDGGSVCSGTFTLDLSTFQAIQDRCQPPSGSVRNNRRPHSSVSVNDPQFAQYDRDAEFRDPRPYPHGHRQHIAHKHQPHFRNGVTNYPRNHQAARIHRDFADERGPDDQFQNCRDYNDCERNQYPYKRTYYDADGYRCQEQDCPGCSEFVRFIDADSHHRADDGYRQPPCFSNGFPTAGRRDEREQMDDDEAALRDSAFHPSSLPNHRCFGSNFTDSREDYRQRTTDRYDKVPTRDVPAPRVTGVSSRSRSQTSSYREPGSGHAPQIENDTGSRRCPPSANSLNDSEPVSRQEPKDGRTGSRSYGEPSNRPRSSSASRYESDHYRPVHFQPRQNQATRCSGTASESEARESQSHRRTADQEPADRRKQAAGLYDKPVAKPRSASAGRHEADLRPSAYLQPRQNQVRNGGGSAADVPTSSPETQSYRTSNDDHRGDTRRENLSSSTSAKAPESFSASRSFSGTVNLTSENDPSGPRDVPDGFRSSDVQDGRGSTEQTVEQEQDTKYRRSSFSKFSVSGGRRDVGGRRVKFQSDPDLSHKGDDRFHESPHSGGGSTYPSKVNPGRDQTISDRKYQCSESLRSSDTQSRDRESRENPEPRRYSSQTSLFACGRSAASGAKSQPVPRTRSVDRVDRTDPMRKSPRELIRSRDSSGDRRRILPRAPIDRRRTSDNDEASSAIRDVTSELTRMTSSVINIDSRHAPPQPSPDKRSPPPDSSRNIASTPTSSVRRLTTSTGDLDSGFSTKSALGISGRLEDQKRKKLEQRGAGFGGENGTLLAQIQDHLHSSRKRYISQLDAAAEPTSRSVVCEEDPNTSPTLSGNIINTALIDSQVRLHRQRRGAEVSK